MNRARDVPGKYRNYSDADRTAALLALEMNGGNVSRTAREIGIPASTIEVWRNANMPDVLLKYREHKNGDMAAAFRQLVWMLAGGLCDVLKIRRAPLNQVATAAGIMFDKLRLLEGQPTRISDNLNTNTALPPTIDLTQCTDDEIRTLREIARRQLSAEPADSAAADLPTVGKPAALPSAGRTGAHAPVGPEVPAGVPDGILPPDEPG